ncbi:MAG: GNAT family N-acetyltransferase [Lachnospiraceae bacterium]|nr:GNAT family N-acetyltransferase [Lachnospiraceae bacterium]
MQFPYKYAITFIKNEKHLFFAVCLADEVIGYIDFHDTSNSYDSGYCFHSDYHGKGYAKESYQALIGLFSDMGVKRLTVGTAMNNTPSINLLHSLGFEQIGTEQVSFYQDDSGRNIYFEGGLFELKLRGMTK